MYDYIIIGAGSAGCVLANRLSADPKNSVLLLEAGPKDRNPMIHMPGGVGEVLKSNTLNWKFVSEPQRNLGGRQYIVPRGRTLGGSSSANGMVYIRGHATDYDDWESWGNKGWSYQDVLPYFKQMEDFNRGENAFHGAGGELHISEAPGDNPMYNQYIAAGAELGYATTDDFNGAQQEGFGRYHTTIKDAKRWSSASAFLTPILNRTNLSVITGAEVHEVLLENGKAVGIVYATKKGRLEVKANKEVILCAGAIKSPHILQLSGIGDSADLQAAGIEPRHELPGVGKNLQEHFDVLVRFECKEPISLNGIDRFPKNLQIAWDYFMHKNGIAACNNIEAGAFLKTKDSLDRPDIQLHFVPCNMTGLTDKLPLQHGITLHACILRPKSSGTVKAESRNPACRPKIDFNFLAHEEDWQTAIACFRILRKLMTAKAWGDLIGEEISPGKHIQSDEEIRSILGTCSETVYHPVGTCKMGIDDMAVVDPELKVHGIEGLRIADASIMPSIIGGNTNAPSMMIGEKCAAMILGAD